MSSVGIYRKRGCLAQMNFHNNMLTRGYQIKAKNYDFFGEAKKLGDIISMVALSNRTRM